MMRKDVAGSEYWPIGETLRLYPWFYGPDEVIADLVSTTAGMIRENINVLNPDKQDELVVSLIRRKAHAQAPQGLQQG